MPNFDPYHKWLGIPPGRRPPTYYRLLAIDPAERDVEVIETAAIRQSAYVRNFQAGPHARDCIQVLKELALARDILLDFRKRAAYDAQLERSPVTSETLIKVASVATVRGGPSDITRLVNVKVGEPERGTRRFDRRRRPGSPARNPISLMALLTGAILIVAAIPLSALIPSGWSRPRTPADSRANRAGHGAAVATPVTSPPGVGPFERGVACLAKKDFDRAIDEFSAAIRLDPKSAEAYHKRGWCSRQRRDFDRAIADFSKAIELGRGGSYADRGDTYFQSGDDGKALADIEKAIQVDPKNDWAYWVKSHIMRKKGDFRAAIDCLQKAIPIAPKAEYWFFHGLLCEDLNDRYAAIGAYSRVIRLDPDSAKAYGFRAWQYVCLSGMALS